MKYFFLLILFAARLSAATYYYTQAGAGNNDGLSLGNAKSVAQVNVFSFSADDVVIGNGALTTALTVSSSGTSGHVITYSFASGTTLSAAAWASTGAIVLNGKNYVTLDGANCTISNTTNGTGLANSATSNGIVLSGTKTGVTVKNFTISNIYQNTGSGSGATDTNGVDCNGILVSGTTTSLRITANTISGARAPINVGFGGVTMTTVEIDNNTLADQCWGIVVGAGTPNTSIMSGLTVHHNAITNWTNWQYPTATYHTDGLILFGSTNQLFSPVVYGNYIYGDLGAGSPTAFIYVTTDGNSASSSTPLIYNNLLVKTGTSNTAAAIWFGGYTYSGKAYNNTIVGTGTGSTGGVGIINGSNSGTGQIIQNNIFYNLQRAIGSYYSNAVSYESTSAVNYNDYYTLSGSPFYQNDGGTYYSLAAWQALGYDANSSTTNPALDGSYKLASNILPGTSLSGTFTTDRDGDTRSAWNMGMDEYAAGDVTAPTPNPATIASTQVLGSTSYRVTATTATDETALHATPYDFSKDGGSSWVGYQASATYDFTGLTANTTYPTQVRYKDAAGNVGTASSSTNVTTDVAAASIPARQRRGTNSANLIP
jgi:hypothetical protein